MRRVAILAAAGVAVAVLSGPAPGFAQTPPPEKKLGWADIGEFSYVATSGNSEANTLGLKNTLTRTWENARFEFKAGAIRAEATTFTRTVTSPGPPVVIDEEEDSQLTAENYYLNGRYDRNITPKMFWFGYTGWDRNRPAGVDSRTAVAGGVGNIWKDTDRIKFRTDYAVSYTDQSDVVEPPDFDGTFLGARFSSNYIQKFGAVTTYGNDFIVDENFDETSDWRGDMTNWVAVSMSARLALKVSLQWLYDNQPAFVAADDPSGTVPVEDRLVELDNLDSIFTASLVVKF